MTYEDVNLEFSDPETYGTKQVPKARGATPQPPVKYTLGFKNITR